MLQLFQYPFKVWITSVLVGSFLLLLWSQQSNLLEYVFSVDFVQFYFLTALISCIVSIPCLLLLWVCYVLLRGRGRQPKAIRLSLLIVALLCCSAVFIIVSRPDILNVTSGGAYSAIGAYALPLAVGVIAYKQDQEKPASKNEPDNSEV